MSETKLKTEQVKKQKIKKVVKSEDIITLDNKNNIVKKTVQTIDKKLSIENDIELKINDDIFNNEVLEITNEICETNNIVEIEADILEDEEKIIEEPIIENDKTEDENIQIIEEPVIDEIIVDNEYKKDDEILVLSNKEDYSDYQLITEPFEYKHEEKNVIKYIKDKPSVPLIAQIFNSNKEYYNNFKGKSFELYRNGYKLYDSDYSVVDIIFEEDYFFVYGKTYSYQGIRIKIK